MAESIVKSSAELIERVCDLATADQEVSASSNRLLALTHLVNRGIRAKS